MKIVQFDNGYYGIRLWYGAFLDNRDPVGYTWFFKQNVRRWCTVSTIVEAEAIAKCYKETNKPLKYKFLAKL